MLNASTTTRHGEGGFLRVKANLCPFVDSTWELCAIQDGFDGFGRRFHTKKHRIMSADHEPSSKKETRIDTYSTFQDCG